MLFIVVFYCYLTVNKVEYITGRMTLPPAMTNQ